MDHFYVYIYTIILILSNAIVVFKFSENLNWFQMQNQESIDQPEQSIRSLL